MKSQTFKTKVAPEGENFLIQLPFDVRKIFGQARPPIVITVAKYSFRSTVSVYGGEYFIGIRRSHRDAAELKPGQTVSITIALDDAPRVVEAPKDLAAALKKNAAAKAAWEALSFTHKKEHADALLDAKKPETRERRLDKTIEMLLAAPKKKSSASAKKPSASAKKPAKKSAAKQKAHR
jgi:hypothetical protein